MTYLHNVYENYGTFNRRPKELEIGDLLLGVLEDLLRQNYLIPDECFCRIENKKEIIESELVLIDLKNDMKLQPNPQAIPQDPFR